MELESQNTTTTENPYQLARLFVDRGDLRAGVKRLESSMAQALKAGQVKDYFQQLPIALRIYAELMRFDRITEIQEFLQDQIIKGEMDPSPRVYHSLGMCSVFEHKFERGLEYFEKGLSIALKVDSKIDICQAILGIAIVYYRLGRYEAALKEVYNLRVFFQVIDDTDLKMSAKILNGKILNATGRPDEGLEILWDAYKDLKENKSFYSYISLLFAIGESYKGQGDNNMARVYFELVLRSIDPNEFVRLHRIIEEALVDLGSTNSEDYDLVYNKDAHTVTERKKGRVDFKSQFILMDLLKLFSRNPGQVFSKEALVREVWKQEYDPATHDNKVYVTIKRLRRLIEPDYDRPKYIFRSKNGYYLNKSTKVLVQ